MNRLRTKAVLISLFAIAGIVSLCLVVHRQNIELKDSNILTGYVSLAVMCLLAVFNTRKKLSMLPIINARTWLVFHVVFGFAMIAVYAIHTQTLWPSGLYEQILACLFYLVSISGIAGYTLSRIVPRRLRHTGGEIIYARIPNEIYQIREASKKHISSALEQSGNETLSREYQESLAWFLAKPRFILSHISGSGRPSAWVENKAVSLEPFLSDSEKKEFNKVLELMRYKNQIDAHYANQKMMKVWLFFHLPVAVGLLVFVAWHVLLVHLYLI